jgi:hypothetical protein
LMAARAGRLTHLLGPLGLLKLSCLSVCVCVCVCLCVCTRVFLACVCTRVRLHA